MPAKRKSAGGAAAATKALKRPPAIPEYVAKITDWRDQVRVNVT